MRHRTHIVKILTACIIALAISGGLWASIYDRTSTRTSLQQAAQAQSSVSPTLQITDIDTQLFPVIRVYVYGKSLPNALNALPLRLEEDRVEQPLTDSQLTEVGVQTAVVLDASRNILSTGNTGAPRLDEVSRVVGQFVQLGLLSAQTDWLAAYATGSDEGDFEVIADWQQDHQGVVNSLIQWRPETRPVITSLFGIIQATFEQFKTPAVPNSARRSMVVFSDGADIVSNIETDDIVRLAREHDVNIHTVLLGTPVRDSRRNLGRLADLTGGLFVELTTTSDLDPVWRTIGSERVQQVLTYRLSQAQPTEVRVAASLTNGRELFATRSFPLIGTRPVEVKILSPIADEPFVISQANTDGTQGKSGRNMLPIQVAYSWPDGHPRDFQRVEFTIDVDTRTVNTPPFDQFYFPVDNFTQGYHTVRVTAIDELGISSTSAPISLPFSLAESAPMASTSDQSPPLADASLASQSQAAMAGSGSQANGLRIGNFALPASIQVANYTIPLDLPTIGMIAFPSLLLLLVPLFLRSRSRSSNPYFVSESQAPPDPYADLRQYDPNIVTVPSMSAFEMDDVSTEPVRMLEFDVVAELILHSGATHLPERFPLYENQQTRIGRHSSYSDIILEDTRVSRQHAIIEWENGMHVVRDEGSAGGTYVNRRRLGVGDRQFLSEGDIINFNEIAYRYEMVLDRSEEQQQPVYEDL